MQFHINTRPSYLREDYQTQGQIQVKGQFGEGRITIYLSYNLKAKTKERDECKIITPTQIWTVQCI